MITRQDVKKIIEDRPWKFSAEDVGYTAAPEGSVMRCASCLRYFRRAIDGHATCEIFRSEEVDEHGVDPAYRCSFFTVDGDIFPLLEEE